MCFCRLFFHALVPFYLAFAHHQPTSLGFVEGREGPLCVGVACNLSQRTSWEALFGHHCGLVEGAAWFESDANDRRTGLAKIQPIGTRMSMPIIGSLDPLWEDHKEMPSAGECWVMISGSLTLNTWHKLHEAIARNHQCRAMATCWLEWNTSWIPCILSLGIAMEQRRCSTTDQQFCLAHQAGGSVLLMRHRPIPFKFPLG